MSLKRNIAVKLSRQGCTVSVRNKPSVGFQGNIETTHSSMRENRVVKYTSIEGSSARNGSRLNASNVVTKSW
jgi:hypothetical protein